MKRTDLQDLAEMRLTDAKALLDVKRYGASYYLAGYAVECAIKACLAKQFQRHSVPDRRVVNGFYSHNLEELASLAGLKRVLDSTREADPEFDANWRVVIGWTPDSRYEPKVGLEDAKILLDAINDPKHGIAPWLRRLW